ncbi:hypothetical protein ABIF78_007752 [Bradyrhizobium japonicum]|jgi:hypothetical protein
MIRILIAAMALIILTSSIAQACSAHRRKPVKCYSYTNINGTTRSSCR